LPKIVTCFTCFTRKRWRQGAELDRARPAPAPDVDKPDLELELNDAVQVGEAPAEALYRVGEAEGVLARDRRGLLVELRDREGADRALLFEELEARRGAIWAGLLGQLAAAQEALATTPAAPSTVRMADFDSFGWRLAAALGQAQAWAELVRKVEREQSAFAADGDGVVEALRILLA
jgi:hypothetical protein